MNDISKIVERLENKYEQLVKQVLSPEHEINRYFVVGELCGLREAMSLCRNGNPDYQVGDFVEDLRILTDITTEESERYPVGSQMHFDVHGRLYRYQYVRDLISDICF